MLTSMCVCSFKRSCSLCVPSQLRDTESKSLMVHISNCSLVKSCWTLRVHVCKLHEHVIWYICHFSHKHLLCTLLTNPCFCCLHNRGLVQCSLKEEPKGFWRVNKKVGSTCCGFCLLAQVSHILVQDNGSGPFFKIFYPFYHPPGLCPDTYGSVPNPVPGDTPADIFILFLIKQTWPDSTSQLISRLQFAGEGNFGPQHPLFNSDQLSSNPKDLD